MTPMDGWDDDLRQAMPADLPALNRVVEAAVMSWNLPERVKRLSLPSYRYDEADLQHLILWLVEQSDSAEPVLAVAGWEAADASECPSHQRGLLLHGLYVLPQYRHHGLGTRLLQAAEQAAGAEAYAGVLVKAQKQAAGFFRKQGYQPLPVTDCSRDYAHRFWKPVIQL
ncbi:MAG: GNAT family N-acetyltransferase [Thiolinea sp.]